MSNDYYSIPRHEMLDLLPDRALNILEIGCGSGQFGRLVKSRYPESKYWGIELNPIEAEAAALVLDNVLVGEVSERLNDLRTEVFDLIVCNDVLEHLVEPGQVLREIRNNLSGDGIILASIPNILFFYQMLEMIIQQDWKYVDAGILDRTHLRFFTKKSMIRLFEESGYGISLIKGINASYGLKYLIANFVTFGFIRDWKYPQFALIASPANNGSHP